MNVLDAIRLKRSVRRFAPDPLPDDAVRTILNAGRRAQSSKNTQPWQFVAVTDRDILTQLSQTGDFAGHLAGAALGVVLVAPDDPERHDWLMFDLARRRPTCSLRPGSLASARHCHHLSSRSGAGDSRRPRWLPLRCGALVRLPRRYKRALAAQNRVDVTHSTRWFTTSAGELKAKKPSTNNGQRA